MPVIDSERPRLDAIADLYINVTAEDVAAGVPRDHCNCAVAHAIKRAVGTPQAKAVIYPSVAYVLMPADQATARAAANRGSGVHVGELAWHRFQLTPQISSEIVAFDYGRSVQTGTFRFLAPRGSQTLRAKREKSGSRSKGRRAVTVRMPWMRNRESVRHVLRDQEIDGGGS